MKKLLFAATLFVCCAFSAFAQQQVPIGTATQSAADSLSARISSGSRVAVVAMQADSGRLSSHLVNKMTQAFVLQQGRHGFTVMDREQLDLIFGQLAFDMSDFVDTATAQRAGGIMGVQFVVVGEFIPIGGHFHFRVRVIQVATADIWGLYNAFIQNDDIISYLRSVAPVAHQPPPPPQAAPAPVAAITQLQGPPAGSSLNEQLAWRSVSVGAGSSMVIRADGTLWAWGMLGNGTIIPTQIGTATNWASVSIGNRYVAAIRTDGSLWAWGYNRDGQLGDGTAAADRHTPVQIEASTD